MFSNAAEPTLQTSKCRFMQKYPSLEKAQHGVEHLGKLLGGFL